MSWCLAVSHGRPQISLSGLMWVTLLSLCQNLPLVRLCWPLWPAGPSLPTAAVNSAHYVIHHPNPCVCVHCHESDNTMSWSCTASALPQSLTLCLDLQLGFTPFRYLSCSRHCCCSSARRCSSWRPAARRAKTVQLFHSSATVAGAGEHGTAAPGGAQPGGRRCGSRGGGRPVRPSALRHNGPRRCQAGDRPQPSQPPGGSARGGALCSVFCLGLRRWVRSSQTLQQAWGRPCKVAPHAIYWTAC